MEKEKKSGFLRLGRLFTKTRNTETQRADSGDPKEKWQQSTSRSEEEQEEAADRASPKEMSSLEGETSPPEVKKRSFGSWRLKKRRSMVSMPITPSSSPTDIHNRSFEISDEHDLQQYSMFLTSPEYSEIFDFNQKEPQLVLQANADESKPQPAESPKRDTTKKPVLGKFGNLFNSNKRRQSKTSPDSPTSPTSDRSGTSIKSSDKDSVRERRRAQVSVTPETKVHQASKPLRADTVSDQVSKEAGLLDNQTEINNGKNDNGLHQSIDIEPSVLEAPLATAEKFTDHNSAAENPAPVTDALSGTSQKPAQSPSARLYRQNSSERNVRLQTYVPGRRNSATEGEISKVPARKLQVFSQEININKEESPKALPKKVSKFSGRITESKLKVADKAAQDLASAETPNSQVQEPADGKEVSAGGISPGQSPSAKEISAQQDKLRGTSPSDKVLAFDIYLSKSTGTNSQSQQEGHSTEEQMENSPSNRKTHRRKRSLKSQGSQHEEKKPERVNLEEPVFDNAFEGIPDSPESNVKPVTMLPDPNGTSTANQDSKAGANHKLSPRGESDKSKQQHPASSPGKKKRESQSLSTSPTAHKGKDTLFKAQSTPSAKATEGNQPAVAVSTTKDGYVEKASASVSCAARSCETAGESSSHTAGAASPRTIPQESLPGGYANGNAKHTATDLDIAKHRNPAAETSKSTVTSKISIPPKPKNVEIPIKPKGSDIVESPQDSAPEQNIHRGNTATKISLFENKRASHRIDIYATKNITQPRKYVERAKLNFGRQGKGAAQKDPSPASKPFNELKSPNSNKLQHVALGIKVKEEQQAELGNKAEVTKQEVTKETVVSQAQMEDSRYDLDTAVTLDGVKTENAEPLLKHETLVINNESFAADVKVFKSPKDDALLNENIAAGSSVVSEDDILSQTNTDERLSHLFVESPVAANEDKTTKEPKDMGNVNKNNAKEQSAGQDPREESKEVVATDHVDSFPPATPTQKEQPAQLNGSGEVSNVASESLTAHSAPVKDTSRMPQIKTSKKKSPTKETAKKSVHTKDTKLLSEAEQHNSKESSDVYSAVAEHDQVGGEPLEHREVLPESEAALCSEKLAQATALSENTPVEEMHQHDHQESNSPFSSGSPTAANIQPDNGEYIPEESTLSAGISNSSQSAALSITENNDGLKEEHTFSSGSPLKPQMELSPLHVTTDNLAIIHCTDEMSSHSPDKPLTVIPGISEDALNAEYKDQTCGSGEPQQGNELSAEENGINGPLSPAGITQDMPILKHYESDLEEAVEQKQHQDEIFYDTSEHLVRVVEPGSVEPSGVIEDENYYKKVASVKENEADIFLAADMKDNSDSYPIVCGDKQEVSKAVTVPNALHEKDETNVNEGETPAVVSSVHQNGHHVDPDTTPYSNGSPQNSPADDHYFNNIQDSPLKYFNASATSDEGVFDTSSDMENFAETIRKLDSPVTLPQKRKKTRAPKSPGPYYGLPPIREDYLEKILDEGFSFGLGKKERAKDQPPMALFKMQSKVTAEKMRPKRASAEQSMLLKSLKSTREPLLKPQEACDKESADITDLAVKRSRIDSLYSTLKLAEAKEESVFSPSVTTVSTITTSFSTSPDSAPTGKYFDSKSMDSASTAQTSAAGEETSTSEAVPGVSSDNVQVNSINPAPSNLPGSMEKYLEVNNVTRESPPLPGFEKSVDINYATPDGKIIPAVPLEGTTNLNILDGDNTANDIFYFKGYNTSSGLPVLGAQVNPFPVNGAEKINPRPGKLVIFTDTQSEGSVIEIFTDVVDCTSWELSPSICIKTVRGCWILYEHPNFEGRTIALEEGDLELANLWREDSQAENTPTPTVIGSLRHVVKDYRICQIDLFTEPEGLGIMMSHFDDTEELQVYGRLQKTCSIKVHWGVWLIYEEPDFQGIPYIMEPGEYPDLSFWNTHEAYIGSMRPLKMGSRKVEIPYEPKIVIYEKPLFEGRPFEFEKELLKLEDLEYTCASEDEPVLPFSTIGSIRVLSGLWVGYEKPGFEGHQYLLEEGDYAEWNHWGGYNGMLQSLRPILSDFSSPHMTMYSEKDFDEKGPNINVLGIIANMEETGFGVKIQSINVLSGVWVAYEFPDFTGEQYVLEKGMYSHIGDWGGKNFKISSVQPVLLDTIENPRGSIKVVLFSEPDFQGESQLFEEDTNSIGDSFATRSCKVISGSWAAYEQQDFSGNLYVLEEGNYPNLCAMGCPQDTAIMSLKFISYEFSEPSIVLYGKENYQGRKIKLMTESTSLQAMGYSPDLFSVEILGGIWVLYEYSNYRGRQVFLVPSKIPQWQQLCGWNNVGSLRPLRQKRLYFKLKNKGNGMFMSTNGSMDDIKLLRIQVMEDTGVEDQIWVYQEGLIKCRIAEDCSLATSGTLVTTGSKLGLTLEQTGASMHWNISPDGRIYSRGKSNLVLDIKGGNQYDQQHVILNPVTEGKFSQLWEICIL